jgi:hypothetical protein
VKRRIGVATREELLAEDGLSFLPSMIESRHPISPYADTMDIHLVEASKVGSSSTAGRRRASPTRSV